MPPRLILEVRDEAGDPIESAHALLRTDVDGTGLSFPPTDAQGTTSIARQEHFPTLLQVWCEGYYPTARWLLASEPSTVRVTLRPAGFLFGSVRRDGYSGELSGVRVFAWPTWARTSPVNLLLRASGGPAPDGAVVQAAADGTFEFRTLAPEGQYNLMAAGLGFATATTTRVALPQTEAVELRLGCLYGVTLRVSDGRPPGQTSVEGMAQPIPPPFQPALPGFEYLPQPSLIPPLAGLSGAVSQNTLSSSTYLFVGDLDTPVIGPLTYDLVLLGYLPAREAIQFPRVVDHVDEHRITLSPEGQLTGRCVIDLNWPDELFRHARTNERVTGRVALSLLGGDEPRRSARRLELPIGFPERTAEFQVPYGTYAVSYTDAAVGFHAPEPSAAKVTVEVAEPVARASLDLRQVGGVRIALLDSEGAHYSTSGSVLIMRGRVGVGDRAPGTQVGFDETPFVLLPLRPGEYTVMLLEASTRLPRAFHHLTVDAGKVAELSIRVEP